MVIYDGEGYPALRQFLKNQGIRHVLLAGYNTDMCVCSTTAGYKNLRKTSTYSWLGMRRSRLFRPSRRRDSRPRRRCASPALNLFITQASWVRPVSAVLNH